MNINTPEYWDNHYLNEDKEAIMINKNLEHKAMKDIFSDIEGGKTVYDLGCGYAHNLLEISKIGEEIEGEFIPKFKCVGVDQSLVINNINNIDFENIEFVTSDIFEYLKFLRNADIITCFEVLEHFERPFQLLNKISKSLKDDGIFVFSVPHENCPDSDMSVHYSKFNFEKTTNMIFKKFEKVQYFNQSYFGSRIYGKAEILKV